MKQYMQYQQDVNNQVGKLMTQISCASMGIDYSQLEALAQQQHLNGIMQMEQQRQMNQAINRYYGGGGVMGKLKQVFSPSQFPVMPVNPLASAPMGFPMPQAINPMVGMIPPIPPYPAAPEPNRMVQLENKLSELQNALSVVAGTMNQQTAPQPTVGYQQPVGMQHQNLVHHP